MTWRKSRTSVAFATAATRQNRDAWIVPPRMIPIARPPAMRLSRGRSLSGIIGRVAPRQSKAPLPRLSRRRPGAFDPAQRRVGAAEGSRSAWRDCRGRVAQLGLGEQPDRECRAFAGAALDGDAPAVALDERMRD